MHPFASSIYKVLAALPVEVGRRAGVVRRSRHCRKRQLGAVGDEKRRVLEYPAVQALRVRHAHLFFTDMQCVLHVRWRPSSRKLLVQVPLGAA